MAELIDFDVVAADNDATPPNGWPENMDYSEVNDSARELLAAFARFVADNNGSIATSGTAPNYILTTNATIAAAPGGSDFYTFAFRCHAGNSGADTQINVDGTGLEDLLDVEGNAPILQTNGIYVVAWNNSLSAWQVIGGPNSGPQLLPPVDAGAGFTLSATDTTRLINITANGIQITVPSSGFTAGEQIRIIKTLGGSLTWTLRNSSGGDIFVPNGTDIGDSDTDTFPDGTYTLTKLSGSDWVLQDA